MPGAADDGIPQSGFAAEVFTIQELDVVLQRHPAYAGGDEQVLDDLPPEAGVTVDEVEIDGQRGQFDPVTTDGRPHNVAVHTPGAVRHCETAQVRAVESGIDDLAAAAAAPTAVDRRQAGLDVDVGRQPRENRVDVDPPAAGLARSGLSGLGGRCRLLCAGDAGRREQEP